MVRFERIGLPDEAEPIRFVAAQVRPFAGTSTTAQTECVQKIVGRQLKLPAGAVPSEQTELHEVITVPLPVPM